MTILSTLWILAGWAVNEHRTLLQNAYGEGGRTHTTRELSSKR